eukprot:4862743-Pyramimonas_sp.AAC.1
MPQLSSRMPILFLSISLAETRGLVTAALRPAMRILAPFSLTPSSTPPPSPAMIPPLAVLNL